MEFSSLKHYTDSNFSYPLDNETIVLVLATKKNDNFKKVFLVYDEKFKFTHSLDTKREVELKESESDTYFSYYKIVVKVKDVRFGYVFKFIDYDDKVYYFLESGITKEEDFDFNETHYEFFQVSYINSSDVVKVNEKFRNRVVYQIFVDRFFNYVDIENKDNLYTPMSFDIPKNKRINISWGDNNKVSYDTIAGGNLDGVIAKLDYLKDLGIGAIYLTPIFEAYSNHKYETFDYYTIAKDFGTLETLKKLVYEAHKRDIMIILDAVFNHTAYYHPFFQDVIKNKKNSKYYNYYMIHEIDDEGTVSLEKKNFESFGYSYFMPKLNLNNEEVQTYCLDVLLYYKKECNIDGFRFDVADEIAHTFFKRVRRELTKLDKDIYLIGEDWHDSHKYLDDQTEFDAVMNYSLTNAFYKYFVLNKLNTKEFKESIIFTFNRLKRLCNHNNLNLLDSHDTARFFSLLSKDENKFIISFFILFLLNGIPLVYYGDETGISGNRDPDCRKMFIWDESKFNNKITKYMKDLIHLRNEYKFNEFEFKLDENDDILYLTLYEENEYLLAYNKDKELSGENINKFKAIINLSKKDYEVKNSEGNDIFNLNKENNIIHPSGFILIKM